MKTIERKKSKAMKKMVITLTPEQLQEISTMRTNKKARFFILGQAYIEPNDAGQPIGAAEFFYLSKRQGEHIKAAIYEAREMR